MTTRWMYPPEVERERERNAFDPVAEGNRYRLSREVSLAIWQRVRAEASDSAGRLDIDQARRRFHDIAARIAARGGRLHPDVGRVSRVDVEVNGLSLEAWNAEELAARVPGRRTLATDEARRWERAGDAATALGVTEASGAGAPNAELPGASAVTQAMAALQQPGPRDRATPLAPEVGARMSRLFDFDLSRVAVVPESSTVTGLTRAVTRGAEVHFRAGAYRPGTPEGDWLIAHELAHVVQQQAGRGERTGERKEIEREADRAASLVARGRAAPIQLRADRAVAYAFDDGDAHDTDVDESQLDKKDEVGAKGRDSDAGPEGAEGDTAHTGNAAAHPAQDAAGDEDHHAEADAAGAEDDIGAPVPAEDAPPGPPAVGGAPAPKPQKPAPDVSGAKPEAGLAQLQGVRPDRLTLLFGQVHTAAGADVAQQRDKLQANPPKEMSTGAPAAGKGGAQGGGAAGAKDAKHAAAAGAKDGAKPGAAGAVDPKAGDAHAADAKAHELPAQPVKAEVPGAESDKQVKQSKAAEQQKSAPQVIATVAQSISSWFSSWFHHGNEADDKTPKMSETETKQMSGSLEQLPTKAGVSTDTGPAPAIAMKGEAQASAAKDRAKLEATTAGLESQGRADSRASMGEDHIEPTAAPEELSAAAVPGGAAAEPALPTVAGAAASEEVGIVAQEQQGAEIDAALTKASADAGAERAKHAQAEAQARAESDKQLHDVKAKADEDQAAARTAAQAQVQEARGQWQAEIDKKGSEARTQANKKVAEGMTQVAAEELKANTEAKQHIDEGKRKAEEEKQKGEKEAADAKEKGKHKSSGFFGWLASKAKAAFDGIKKAVTAAIDACKKAVKAVIDAAKKLAMAAIELARKVITAAIKAVGQALIAISNVLLAAFPGLKAKFQGLIKKAVDKAVNLVNKLADGLKKAVQKALDLLGKALDKALSLLNKGLNAIIDAANAVVQGAIKAAQAVVDALGTWVKLIKDIASGPGAWLKKLGAAVVDGIKNHLWSAFKTAVLDWFKSKVFELLGVGGIILELLLEGGLTKDHIIQMALDALMTAIPAALIAILVEKLVAMIIPAAGAVMAIIEGLQAAWGTISRIIAAISAFVGFLLAVKTGSAGPLFAGLLAAAAVILLDFVANWLLKKLMSAARKVGAKLKGLAEKFKAKRKAKKDAKAKKKRDEHDAKHKDHDKDKDNDKKKEEDKRKRLAEAVRDIRPKLAALLAKQPSKLRVRGQLIVWKLRHRLTELRMDTHGKRIEFIAKINPEENAGSADDIPLGDELKNAESPRAGFYYRGDDEWRPGQSVGVPLDEHTPTPGAEELIAHVHPKAKDERKRTSRGDDDDDAGPTKTFVSFSEIIGNKTGGAAKFTRKNRISKVARDALDRLVAEGKLRILTPEDVRDIIAAHPKAKIAREANNVMRTMQNNHEILIQGLIPGDLLTPAK